MKFTALTLIVALAAPAIHGSNTDALLQAIRLVETENNDAAVGRAGERGAYQFRHGTWRQHTSLSFTLAHDREVATEVAKDHLDWLRKTLTEAGVEPTPRNVALAWNAGIGHVIRGTAPARCYDYADRVVALAN